MTTLPVSLCQFKNAITNLMKIPSNYQNVKSMPDDPPRSTAYMTATSNSEVFALVYPISFSEAMPFSNDASIIRNIRASVADNQALIEVNSGKTKSGNPYVYSIVKTLMEPQGVQYTLILQIMNRVSGDVENLRAFFSESGMTGVRDAQVYAALVQQGYLKSGDTESWMKDQYEPSLKRNVLMNLSEYENFDEFFPEHPLSVARNTIQQIIENN